MFTSLLSGSQPERREFAPAGVNYFLLEFILLLERLCYSEKQTNSQKLSPFKELNGGGVTSHRDRIAHLTEPYP